MDSILPRKYFYPKLSTHVSVVSNKETICSFKLPLPKMLKSVYQKNIVFDLNIKEDAIHEIFDLYSTKNILDISEYFSMSVRGGADKEKGRLAVSCHLLVNHRGDTFEQQVRNHIDYTYGDLNLEYLRRSKVQLHRGILSNHHTIFLTEPTGFSFNTINCGMYLKVNDMYAIRIAFALSIDGAKVKDVRDTLLSIAQPLLNTVSMSAPQYAQKPSNSSSETSSPEINSFESQREEWLACEIPLLLDREDQEVKMLTAGLITKQECHTEKAKNLNTNNSNYFICNAGDKNYLQQNNVFNLDDFNSDVYNDFSQKIQVPAPIDSNDLVTKAMLDDIKITADKLRRQLYPLSSSADQNKMST